MSFDRLIERILETKNPTVAGLDPNFSYVPEFIREKYASISDPLEAASKAVLEFNCGLIDALCDHGEGRFAADLVKDFRFRTGKQGEDALRRAVFCEERVRDQKGAFRAERL